MRLLSRRKLALGVAVLFVLRIGYFLAYGLFNGYGPGAIATALLIDTKQYLLGALVLFVVVWRPTGTGALVSTVGTFLRRGELLGADSVSRRALALESLGVCLCVVGTAGTAFFAQVPGRYVNRHSLAGSIDVESVAGLDGNWFFLLLVAGVVVWLLPWMLAALDVSDQAVYRQPD